MAARRARLEDSVIDDIKEAFEIIVEEEKHLVFFDDFLGQVRLSADLIRGMDQRFPPFFQKVRKSKNMRFILTTRDYILHQAQAQSNRLSTPAVNAAEFVLNVGFYTRATKAQMLYNHIYFSDLSKDERGSLLTDDFFLKIIDHRNFNPRLIDLLTSADYISIAGRPIRETIGSALENPHELWEKPFRMHISDEGRALMLALFFNSERVSLDALERSFSRMIVVLELSIPKAETPVRFRSAVRELEGSVLAIQERTASFSNPGIRDFLERVIVEDRLIGPIVSIVTDYEEVSQAWDSFCSQERISAMPLSLSWAGVAARLVVDGSGTPLERLHLLVDMYDRLNEESLLESVSVSIDDLRDSEIGESEISLSKAILEQLCLSLLPPEILQEAKEVVTAAVAKMITDYGSGMLIDDFKSVTETLFKYGTDEGVATEASRAALETLAEDLHYTLAEIQSVDELDSYERELYSLMRSYGLHDSRIERRIESRRDVLVEREARDSNDDYEGPRVPPSFGRTSDDQIRSMFSSMQRP